jgi:hypothetical protein
MDLTLKDRMVILSADMLERPINWKSASHLEPDHIAEDDRVLSNGAHSETSKGFRLQSADQPCKLRIHFDPELSKFHPVIDLQQADALIPDFHLKLLRKNGNSEVPPDGILAIYTAAFRPLNGKQARQAALEVTWQPRLLSKNNLYKMELRLGYNPNAIRYPSFISEWSVQTANAIQGNRFDGSKTQNLQELVAGLSRILLEQHGKMVGAFDLYFQK